MKLAFEKASKNVPLIVRLQARFKGHLVRKNLNKREQNELELKMSQRSGPERFKGGRLGERN